MNTYAEGMPAAINATRFLFWNIGRRPLLGLVAAAVAEYQVDVLVLAECEIPEDRLRLALRKTRGFSYFSSNGYSPRLKMYSRFPERFLQAVEDYPRMSIRCLQHPLGQELLLVAVHLPSKMYQEREDQLIGCTRFARRIMDAESRAGHTRTIVVGDFNMNPFEPGVVGADGFHAIMDPRIAAGRSRRVQGEDCTYFYNPMWHCFGDGESGPMGTYFFNRSGRPINYFWHTFDQVLIRPDLLESFDPKRLSVVTKIGDTTLIAESGRPDKSVGSDHLPLIFDLSL